LLQTLSLLSGTLMSTFNILGESPSSAKNY
jgi:hypothetical protein